MNFKGFERARSFSFDSYGFEKSEQKEQCEVDFLYGYNTALKDSFAHEMLEMLIELRKNIDFSYSSWCSNEGSIIGDRLDELLKKVTTL